MKTVHRVLGVLLACAPLSAPAQNCPQAVAPVLLRDPASNGVGYAVAADGDIAAVGSINTPQAAGTGGPVRVYRREGSGWALEAQFMGSDRALDLVAGRLVIPSYRGRLPGAPGIKIYERRTDAQGTPSWPLIASTPAPTPPVEYFPAFDFDGQRLGVASVDPAMGNPRFKLYTLDPAAPQGLRPDAAVPLPSVPFTPTTASQISYRVVLAGDNAFVTRYHGFVGLVDVLRRTGNSWAVVQRLGHPSGTSTPKQFGVAIAARGDVLLVMGELDGNSSGGLHAPPGHILVYRRSPATGQWALDPTPIIPPTSAPSDGFGTSMDLSDDRLAVGAPLDPTAGDTAGAAYLFDRVGDSFVYRARYGVANSTAGRVGTSVALLPSGMLAGGIGLSPSGAGIVFDPCSPAPTPGSAPRCIPGILGLITFIQSWFNRDPFGDYDGSGAWEIGDLFLYITDWFAGCP